MNSPTQPRTGHDKRQRLKQRKMNNDLNIATWNVRSLLRPGELRSLTSALRKTTLDITAVQETRCPGNNSKAAVLVDERLCSLRIRTTLSSTSTRTQRKRAMRWRSYFTKNWLGYDHDQAPKRNINIVLGDLNAKIGREVCHRPIIGTYYNLHENSNDNGTRVVDFVASRNGRCFEISEFLNGITKFF